MEAKDVQGRVEELLYAIQFDRDLNDFARADCLSGSIRDQRNFRHSPAEYSAAIASVLRDGHLPANAFPTRHSEADILNWFRRLAEQLNAGSHGAPTID